MSKKYLMAGIASLLYCCANAAYAQTTLQNTNTSGWQGSLILEGIYFDHTEDDNEEHHGIPGFADPGHHHGFREGLHTGHNEAVVSGPVTSWLNAQVTTAFFETEEDGLEVELEEAWLETLGLGYGLTLRGGRFYSDIGYLSSKHNHEWDFADNALVYQSLFGSHVIDDGLRISYTAPTPFFLQLGSELFRGDEFPAGKTDRTPGVTTFFAKIGNDIGTNHSWLMSLGHWHADDIRSRSGEEHDHGGDETETPVFNGESDISSIGLVYKWAPQGNWRQRHFKLQGEYFHRDENGDITLEGSDPLETASYDGKQSGWYLQGVYQFLPGWRAGLRYDRLGSNNKSSDEEVLEESGLLSTNHTPQRQSVMIDYSPREYSRLRLQYNHDESTEEDDDQLLLQFIYSFGSHGAHGF